MTKGSRSQMVAEWMRQQIRDGAWPLNTRIPTETELANLLGVGRSTVREATRSIADTGMLESGAGRGTFVRARSPVNAVLTDHLVHQPIRQVLGLRRAIEVEAAGLAARHRSPDDIERLRRSLDAAPRRDPEPGADRPDATGALVLPSPGSFHADIFDAAGNPLLAEFYQCAVAALRNGVSRGVLIPGTAAERLADHQRILEAIIAGDVEGARAAAADHADRDFVFASPGSPDPVSVESATAPNDGHSDDGHPDGARRQPQVGRRRTSRASSQTR
ncbi:FadR/GntR family transcriptional regulator [Solwaraspora sp. WMMB335]|uniref:FadR/GntR family transcriptional regulator n=1 Tax=Solwaraspora sp. WMMB335 TaxID=3404118 RepID=UPI003B94B71C